MGSIAEILAAVASISVVVGVVIALAELRTARRARTEQTVMAVYGRMGEPEFISLLRRVYAWQFKDYESFRERATTDDWTALWSVGVYFEGLGLMVKRGTAPLDLVDDLVSSDILVAWPKFEPIIGGYRKAMASPQTLEWFEFLYRLVVTRQTTSQR
jgi:hypothetical protein